jgi:putative DNA primase/helicase
MVIAAPSSPRNEKLADTYEKLRRAPSEFKLLHFPERMPVGAHTAEPNRVYLAAAQPFNEHDEAATIVRKLVAGIRAGEIAKDDETKRILDMAREIGVALAVAIRTAVEAAVAQGGLPLRADGVTILRPPAANDDAPVIEPEAPKDAPARHTSTTKSRGANAPSSRAPSADECIRQFRDAMDAAGLRMKGPLKADTGTVTPRFHVEGDPKGSLNGWYWLRTDGWPHGQAGSWRINGGAPVVDWCPKGADGKGPTAAEKRAMKERQEELRTQREAEEEERHAKAAARAREILATATDAPADHPYLVRKGIKPYGIKFVPEWVKEWTDEDTGEVHRKTVKDVLLIPIRGPESREIVSLQAIFPSSKNALGRDKDFLSGGRKRGCYFVIGKPVEIDGRMLFVICEGYATAASIHKATGACVIVAFDAGNLAEVTKSIADAAPEGTRIVVAGDNDLWTDKPVPNPGATRAREAAAGVGGVVALPVFSSLEGKPTDFNDLHTRATGGLEVVARQIMAAARGEPEMAPSVAPEEPKPEAEPGAEAKERPKADAGAAAESTTAAHTGVNPSNHFVPLGHDHGKHFFFQREAQQVLSYSGGELMTEGAMTDLAPINWWEISFPGDKGMNKKSAIDWLKRTSYKHGIFKVRAKIRGRGAWMDDGRVVYHLGDRLFVDGKEMGVDQIKSRYIYEQREELPMPAETALTDGEGAHLIEIASMFRWEKKVSGVLAAGWIALAPVCGALGWRPHVWITGEAHCGKSTFVERFAYPLTNEACVYAQGNSTEAGIRQDLDGAALPVIFDESEANNERESMRVDNVLSLIRQSSSASKARTLKGTPVGKGMEFHIQSMFMLSSIGVSMKLQPDLERIAKLSLMKPEKGDEAARNKWRKQLAPKLAEIKRDNTIGARLLRRSLDLLPITLESIKVFIEVYSARFGSERDGDQYGTLLAGAWSLAHSKPVTRGAAEAFIDQFEWTDHLEETESDEPSRARAALLSAKVRFDGARELSVHELVCIAAGKKLGYANVGTDQAAAALKRNGMLVKLDAKAEDGVGILLFQNNSQEIPRLLVGTTYQASWRDQLLRAGAKKHLDAAGLQKSEWFIGGAAKCIELPLKPIIDAGGEEGRSFADDDEGPV